jgi:hypothetical protein
MYCLTSARKSLVPPASNASFPIYHGVHFTHSLIPVRARGSMHPSKNSRNELLAPLYLGD